jgi:agmatinase
MLFYTENPLKFAFSKDISDFDRSDNKKPKFGLIGIPFDSTATYQAGARSGPHMVREASYNFENYNIFLDKKMDAIFFDLGDMPPIYGNFIKTCERIKFTIEEITEQGLIPLVMGGDHSISYAVLHALNMKNTSILHFDAHSDLRDTYLGEKYSHATVMRRIWDLGPKKLIQIGTRSSSKKEAEFVRDSGIVQFNSQQIKDNINDVLEYLKNLKGPIYITLDMDVLDPAYAPSVGTPAPGGLTPLELEKIIFSLENKEIMGMDVVEVSSREIGDITSVNAAKTLLDVLFLQST